MQLMLPLVNSTLDHIEGPATAGATAGAEALQQPAAVAQAPRLPVETPAASAAPQPLETDTFIKVTAAVVALSSLLLLYES